MDSAVISLRRPLRGLATLAERILKAIPCDRWVSAADIAAQVGVSPQKVAHLIRWRILHACVERRPSRSWEGGRHVYRRLPCTDAARTPVGGPGLGR